MKINNRWIKISETKEVYLPTMTNIPLINSKSKVCLIGSCFADEIGWVLKENKIDIGEVGYVPERREVLYPWGTFFSPLNLLEIFEHIFEINKYSFDENDFIRVSKKVEGNNFLSISQAPKDSDYILWSLYAKAKVSSINIDQAKKELEEKLNKLKSSVLNANAIVITLGLIEIWLDKFTNKSWHSFHGNPIKKKSIEDRAVFKRLNFDETTTILQKIIDILTSNNKDLKIIFTVSPIPLNFTFTDQDIVIANKYSKSLIRTAVEQMIDNKRIFYFPSFEIVQDCVGWPEAYQNDKRHIKAKVFEEQIAKSFVKNFCETK